MRKRLIFIVIAFTAIFVLLPVANAQDADELQETTEETVECASPDPGDTLDSTNRTLETANGSVDKTSDDLEDNETGPIESAVSTYNGIVNETDQTYQHTMTCVADNIPETWNCDRIQGRMACVGTNTDKCRLHIIYGLGFCITF